MTSNFLLLHSDKTEVIVFSPKTLRDTFHYITLHSYSGWHLVSIWLPAPLLWNLLPVQVRLHLYFKIRLETFLFEKADSQKFCSYFYYFRQTNGHM